MSMQRKIKRTMEAQQRKETRRRTLCRKCGARMLEKPSYGWVCIECGWERQTKEDANENA